MPQELMKDVVDMLTRRTYATTEGWAPVVGALLSWLAAMAHIGGDGSASAYIAIIVPLLAGVVVAAVAVVRKSAAAKWLHDHTPAAVQTTAEAVVDHALSDASKRLDATAASTPADPAPTPSVTQ